MKVIIGEETIYGIQKIIGAESWPEFMNNDKEVIGFWPKLYNQFLSYQFCVVDGEEKVGVGNSIPVYWEESFYNLPDRGLDWGMEKASEDDLLNRNPNLLIGIQILIGKAYRKMGLSNMMLSSMKQVAKQNNISQIALPLRPTFKCLHPEISIKDYIKWYNSDGQVYDPWLRFHLKKGGKIVGTCDKSMHISGSISDWQNWTGMTFEKSGHYKIDQALSLVEINVEENFGVYLEPNVWIIHEVN